MSTKTLLLARIGLLSCAGVLAHAQTLNIPYGAFAAPILIPSQGSASLSFRARQGDALIVWTARVGLPAPTCSVITNSVGATIVARHCVSGILFSQTFTAPSDDTYTQTVDGNLSFRFTTLVLCSGACPAAAINVAPTLAAPTLQPGTTLSGQVDQTNRLAAFTVQARAGNAYGFTFTNTAGNTEIVNAFGPDGVAHQLTGSGRTLTAVVSPQTDGTYPVLVSPYTGSPSDSFSLSLSCTGANCTPPNILDPTFFVRQLYLDLLGRTGDAAGVQGWANQIANRTATREQIAYNFFNSAEFQQSGEFAIATYIAVLGRDPDFSGWKYWSGVVKQGGDPLTMVNAFIQSPEFQSTYSTLGNTAFVNLVYQNVLGRAPDNNGLNYWSGLLATGQSTRAQIMYGFINSTEFQSRIRNHSLALLLYMGFLRRTADPSGAQYWTSALDTGTTPASVLSAFITSAEYLGRFN